MAFWLDPLKFEITFLWDAAMAVITPHFFFLNATFHRANWPVVFGILDAPGGCYNVLFKSFPLFANVYQ